MPSHSRDALGLPESPHWHYKQLIVNAPSNALLAVFSRDNQGWREARVSVRRFDEPRYRPVQSLGPDTDLFDFVGAINSPMVYSTAMKRSEKPVYKLEDSKLVEVEGEVSKGYNWDAMIAIRLPGGEIERLPLPEAFSGQAKRCWVSEILGLAGDDSLFIRIAKPRNWTIAELTEHERTTGRKIGQGTHIDYLVAEYNPISGTVRELTSLSTPFC